MGEGFSAVNRKAYHRYTIGESWECGLVLTGGEVKSVRAGEIDFKDSFARVEDGEVRLYNLHIHPYRQASYLNEDPDRVRTLLLHKREIRKIESRIKEKGGTLVPLRIYINKRGLVKVTVALARGKRLFDKRETVKKRTLERALKRTLQTRRR